MKYWMDGCFGLRSRSGSTSTDQDDGGEMCSSSEVLQRKHPRGEVNVTRLLALRETTPSARRQGRFLWGTPSGSRNQCYGTASQSTDAKSMLPSWLEADSLRRCSGRYCPLQPAPRSTIAAAFSSDGSTMASTHGDHTVKILCCRTGQCLKTLTGHRRTPWVVRFHPSKPKVLASGSLDHEVHLWDASTAHCFAKHDFYKPIASLAFHANGNILAVASGHKLYIWQYTETQDAWQPVIVLRTRRSLRAVHFHPHGAPLLLTAQVNDLDASDGPLSAATSRGYEPTLPPSIHVTLAAAAAAATSSVAQQSSPGVMPGGTPLGPWGWPHPPGQAEHQGGTSVAAPAALLPNGSSGGQPGATPPAFTGAQEPMDVSPPIQDGALGQPASGVHEEAGNVPERGSGGVAASEDMEMDGTPGANRMADEARTAVELGGRQSPTIVAGVQWDVGGPLPPVPVSPLGYSPQFGAGQPLAAVEGQTLGAAAPRDNSEAEPDRVPDSGSPEELESQLVQQLRAMLPPVGAYTGWELPYLQGWMQGHAQAGQPQGATRGSTVGTPRVGAPWQPEAAPLQDVNRDREQQTPSAAHASLQTPSPGAGASAERLREQGDAAAGTHQPGSVSGTQDTGGRTPGERRLGQGGIGAMSGFALPSYIPLVGGPGMVAGSLAELPCTVKLRVWRHNADRPLEALDEARCRLTVPHAVLCSEMGAHFSPCGRFLAACVACIVPPTISPDSGPEAMAGAAHASPTQHPLASPTIIYELRIYSLEDATFGQVLKSKAVRAAHCLTSVQFSPCSEHILLAYGRRHNSLLRSLCADGKTVTPIFTILEVYRVSDMALVRLVPSVEDEVNVAAFHPAVGGGLVYGTKEGKLRILGHDRSPPYPSGQRSLEDQLLEAGANISS